MAGITQEDCLKHIENRFDMVITAANRARQLEKGFYEPKVERENDKNTVVALREIAAGNTEFKEERPEELPELSIRPEDFDEEPQS